MRAAALLTALLLTSVANADEPWIYPSKKAGLVTCTSLRDGSRWTFRTETVSADELPGTFFIMGVDGNSRKMRSAEFGVTVTCIVKLDP